MRIEGDTMSIQDKLSLFAENCQAIKGSFTMHLPVIKRLSALAYTLENKQVDITAIDEAHQIIKNDVGMFSNFRGTFVIYLATMLSLQEFPQQMFSDTKHVYGLLNQQGFWKNDYLVLSAFEIAKNAESGKHSHVASRAMDFYKEMKANHRFHIGTDDYLFTAMLAMSDMEVHAGANKVRQIFTLLKYNFGFWASKNSLLHLAQVLALGGHPGDCVQELLHLKRILKQRKIRLDRNPVLSALGVVGLFPVNHGDIANELESAINYLRTQKGFGTWSDVHREELLLYAVSILASVWASEISRLLQSDIVSSSTNNMFNPLLYNPALNPALNPIWLASPALAQQVVMCNAVGYCSYATTSSSYGGGYSGGGC